MNFGFLADLNRVLIPRFIGCLMVFACLFSSCSQNEDNALIIKNQHPFETNQLIGHKGDCLHAPENTMPSFEYAVNVLGLQWIECDPVLTKDGVIVLNHGQTIDDHSNGHGYVSEMTYDELCKYDFGNPLKFGDEFVGTKICTATEVIQFAKKHHVIVEFDFSHFNATLEKVEKLYSIITDNNYSDYTVLDPLNINDLQVVTDITTDIAILYFNLDTTLVIPNELYRFKNVFIDLDLRKLGDARDVPVKIHKLGFKAVTELINPVPDNPIEKLKELINSGFDCVYTEGIPRSVLDK